MFGRYPLSGAPISGNLTRPFSQSEQPNPVVDAKRRAATNSGFIDVAGSLLLTTLAVAGAVALPIGQHTWPDTFGRRTSAPVEQVVNTLALGIPQQMGARPLDQPNPTPRVRAVPHEVGAIALTLGIPPPPLFPTDLTQVFKSKYLQLDQVQPWALYAPVVVTAPFTQTDQPNPLARKTLQQDQVLNGLPLSSIVSAPFTQTDQPLPIQRAKFVLHDPGFTILPLGIPMQMGARLVDQPNPAPRAKAVAHDVGQIGLTLGIPPPPLFPTDLTQTFKSKYLQVEQYQPFTLYVTAVTAAPFTPLDQPQLVKTKYQQVDPTANSLLLGIPQQMGARQWDQPNPTPRVRAVPHETGQIGLTLGIPPPPLFPTDLTQTFKARYQQVDQYQPFTLYVATVTVAPFVTQDTSWTYKTKYQQVDPVQNLLINGIPQQMGARLLDQTQTFKARPVSQEIGQPSWVITNGSVTFPFAPVDLTQTFKSKYLQVEQVSTQLPVGIPQQMGSLLTDQPNPIQRPKFVHHEVGYSHLALGIPQSPLPPSLLDQPNPHRYRYVGQIDPIPNTLLLGIPQVMGFNQYDQPNPQPKRYYPQVDQPANILSLRPIIVPLPFAQYDWPNPVRARMTPQYQVWPTPLVTLGLFNTWTPVDDGQSGSWTLVSDTQTPNWSALSPGTSPGWSPVDDSQTSGWTPVDDSETPGWH